MENVQTFKITKTKEIIFSVVFTVMAIYVPMLIHYLGGVDAGRKFLPMPFFVLLAGLVLGWRAGLMTGLASPAISFLISGMPMIAVLPIIIIQLCAYGFFAGLLREKYNTFISLAGAIIFGLFATALAILFFSETNVTTYVMNVVRDGWIGILTQVILIPVLIKFITVRSLQN